MEDFLESIVLYFGKINIQIEEDFEQFFVSKQGLQPPKSTQNDSFDNFQ